MATAETLDLARLLAPLPGDRPSGEDLRDDKLGSIRDKLYQEQIAFDAEIKGSSPPNWYTLAQPASDILASRSKDLNVAGYLSEAALHLHGFAGLRDGFRLLCELGERFWDDLYPLPDPAGGVAKRLTVLARLNRERVLIEPIRKVPLTQGRSVAPIAQWHYANCIQSSGKAQSGRANMEKAAAETDPGFFQTLREDLDQCRDEFQRLCRLLRDKCPGQTLASSAIETALDDCRNALRVLSRESEAPEPAAPADPPAADAPAAPRPAALNSREEALRTLRAVAEYFRRSEPHSPISYLLEQAVRWAGMPLHELVAELINDDKARQTFCRLTGIPTDTETK